MSVDVSVRPATGRPSVEDKTLEAYLIDVIRATVLLTEYPRTQLTVVVQTLCDDGSILAASICAVGLALADAGVQMRGMLTASTVGILPQHASDTSLPSSSAAGSGSQGKLAEASEEHLSHDVTAEESMACRAACTVAFITGTTGTDLHSVLMDLSGTCSPDEMDQMDDELQRGASTALSFLQEAVRVWASTQMLVQVPTMGEVTKLRIKIQEGARGAGQEDDLPTRVKLEHSASRSTDSATAIASSSGAIAGSGAAPIESGDGSIAVTSGAVSAEMGAIAGGASVGAKKKTSGAVSAEVGAIAGGASVGAKKKTSGAVSAEMGAIAGGASVGAKKKKKRRKRKSKPTS